MHIIMTKKGIGIDTINSFFCVGNFLVKTAWEIMERDIPV